MPIEAIASKRSPRGEVAVVHHPDLDPVGDAGLLGPLAGLLGLRLGEGDAEHAGPVLGRRAQSGKAAPAAADVEHPLALLQRQLAGDRVELRFLRLPPGSRLPRREEGAAVGHRLVEEEGEELVGDVVVVADGPRVALLAVALPAGRSSASGRRRRAAGPGGAHAPSSSRALSAPSSGGGCQLSSSSITASMSSTSISPLT